MIRSGEKPEEYREITYYWFRRLFYCDKVESRSLIEIILFVMRHGKHIDELIREYVQPKCNAGGSEDYTHVHFTLGYPRKDDAERNMIKKIKEIVIGTGRPEWGAEPGKEYFVIKFEK